MEARAQIELFFCRAAPAAPAPRVPQSRWPAKLRSDFQNPFFRHRESPCHPPVPRTRRSAVLYLKSKRFPGGRVILSDRQPPGWKPSGRGLPPPAPGRPLPDSRIFAGSGLPRPRQLTVLARVLPIRHRPARQSCKELSAEEPESAVVPRITASCLRRRRGLKSVPDGPPADGGFAAVTQRRSGKELPTEA